jgi:hypothetical protein
LLDQPIRLGAILAFRRQGPQHARQSLPRRRPGAGRGMPVALRRSLKEQPSLYFEQKHSVGRGKFLSRPERARNRESNIALFLSRVAIS